MGSIDTVRSRAYRPSAIVASYPFQFKKTLHNKFHAFLVSLLEGALSCASAARRGPRTAPTQHIATDDMPLTEAQLKELRAENFADDVSIDMSKMNLWTEDQAREYFASGG